MGRFFRSAFKWLFWLAFVATFLSVLAVSTGYYYVLKPEFEKHNDKVLALKQRKSGGKGWQFHSRIYSDSFSIAVNDLLTEETFIKELLARDYKEKKKLPLAVGEFYDSGKDNGVQVYLRGYELSTSQSPSVELRVKFKKKHIDTIYQLPDNTPVTQNYFIEPILLAELMGDPPRLATFVPLSKIPLIMQNAVIASEDERFRTHPGIDIQGFARAAFRNISSRKLKEGASTITQQLARTLFLSTEKSYKRKVSEISIALLLDWKLGKNTLLELYLNSVYLGQVDGIAIHGVEEAARIYFNKHVKDLTISEAATIAGMLPAPNRYSPFKNIEESTRRRNLVLSLLAEQKYIKKAEADEYKSLPIKTFQGKIAPIRYGYYTGYVRSLLSKTLGNGFEMKGLTIQTTLDPVLQTTVVSTLSKAVKERERHYGKQKDPLQGSAFLMDYHTGRVLAVAGGHGYDDDLFNRAFQAYRQPGSAFKPIAYAAAIEGNSDMEGFTAGTTVSDKRKTFQVKEGDWTPKNYENEYHESVTLAKAITKSLNVATVNIVDQIGPQRVVDLAKKLKIENLKPVLSIGLGTNEVTLDVLTSAYSSFPARGLRVDPQAVKLAIDVWGDKVLEEKTPHQRVLKQSTADVMTELLRSVVVYGTAWKLRSENYYPKPAAGKTGTSQDEQDAWFVGFTPEYSLGVWVGFDKPEHLHGSAADVAVPVWGAIMTDVTKDLPKKDFKMPTSLEYFWIDPFSGGRATDLCTQSMRVAFVVGTEPKFSCPSSHEGEQEELEEGDEGYEGESEAPLDFIESVIKEDSTTDIKEDLGQPKPEATKSDEKVSEKNDKKTGKKSKRSKQVELKEPSSKEKTINSIRQDSENAKFEDAIP